MLKIGDTVYIKDKMKLKCFVSATSLAGPGGGDFVSLSFGEGCLQQNIRNLFIISVENLIPAKFLLTEKLWESFFED